MKKHEPSPERRKKPPESQVPTWLWRCAIGLVVTVLTVATGIALALALGWRSPTPRRAPDWTTADLTWGFDGTSLITHAEDGYRMSLTQPDQHAWAIADLRISDFELELEARSLIASEDVGYGVLFRQQNQSNYYLFGIGGDGYYTVAVVRQGQLTPFRSWQQWPHVRRGVAANRLRVRCQGTSCRFYINDEFTAEVIDDTFLAGNLGFWAQSFSDHNLDVVFAGLRVWTLDEKPRQPLKNMQIGESLDRVAQSLGVSASLWGETR